MIKITPGASFKVVLFTRTTRTHLLLVFTNPSTCAKVRCVVTASGDDPIVSTVDETSPIVAVPLSGEVNLSPSGQWSLDVYAQNSSTNLDETDAVALKIGTVQAFVDGDCCTVTGYSPNTSTATCDPAEVFINGVSVAEPASGGTASLIVTQEGTQVGSWSGTEWEIPACPEPEQGITRRRLIALGA